MPFCGACGSPTSDGKFCGVCGAPLEGSPSPGIVRMPDAAQVDAYDSNPEISVHELAVAPPASPMQLQPAPPLAPGEPSALSQASKFSAVPLQGLSPYPRISAPPAPPAPTFGQPPVVAIAPIAIVADPAASVGVPNGTRPRPTSAPPLASRVAERIDATAIARPPDVTTLIHRHPQRVAEGAQIEVGADDTFFGVVDHAVAFALMPGLRRAPQECDGFFVSRGTEGAEIEHELADVADANGKTAEIRLEGRVSFEVVDPGKLLTSDAPLDDDALSAVVVGGTTTLAEEVIRQGVKSGEWTFSALAEGALDTRIAERCVAARFPRLLKSHGIAAELFELRVRHVLEAESDVSAALQSSPPSEPPTAIPDGRDYLASVSKSKIASAAPSPVKMAAAPSPAKLPAAPKPSLGASSSDAAVERPSNAFELVSIHRERIAAGAILFVKEGDAFVAIGDDLGEEVFPPGRHRLTAPFAMGLFLRSTGEPTSFGKALGDVKDFHGATGNVRVFGRVDVKIEDPKAFVDALPDPLAYEHEAQLVPIREATCAAIKKVVEDGLAGGEWDLATVVEEIDELKRRAKRAYAAARGAAGTAIEVLDLNLNVATTSEPAATSADVAKRKGDAPPPALDAYEPPADAPRPSHPPYAVGAQITVLWSDGNRYSGQVQQVTADHCLVMFPNGHQQWVPFDSVVAE